MDRSTYLEIAPCLQETSAICRPEEADIWIVRFKAMGEQDGILVGTCRIEEDPGELLKQAIGDFPMHFYNIQGAWLTDEGNLFETTTATPSEVMMHLVDHCIDAAPEGDPDYRGPVLDALRSGLIEADQISEGLGDETLHLYAVSVTDNLEDTTWMVHAACVTDALNLYADALIVDDIPVDCDDGPDTNFRIQKLSTDLQRPRLVGWDEVEDEYAYAAEVPLLKHAMAQGYDLIDRAWIEPDEDTPTPA